jgi:hypothetical protein
MLAYHRPDIGRRRKEPCRLLAEEKERDMKKPEEEAEIAGEFEKSF